MPIPLPHTSADLLEFDRLREIVRGCCQSELGRQAVDSLAPTAEAAWIECQQQLTTEVRAFFRAGGRLDFGGLIDPRQSVLRARISGATLETTELRDAILAVDRAAEWREVVLHPPQAMREPWPAIEQLSGAASRFHDGWRPGRARRCRRGFRPARACWRSNAGGV